MSKHAEHLLAESLKLSTEERARLAKRLLQSLAPREGTPEEIETAWRAELEQRLARMDSGEPLEDWTSVRKRLVARREP